MSKIMCHNNSAGDSWPQSESLVRCFSFALSLSISWHENSQFVKFISLSASLSQGIEVGLYMWQHQRRRQP